ncbi:GNAT family N-acetyltransferase [Arthrobacter sp. Sa2CUA1]|uniref:GNAT family N-acetyltransferase n=1 Tax=Arthrobacter gallicola TaxID=2762225 RepID=A0ABR8UUX7_9MICC|nr:GNAT family N-acetyltransferase [Arthrobacter gallicola]MBD7996370.1 GNAT family N-acetyltransferase [Arthrobacter gallicola]
MTPQTRLRPAEVNDLPFILRQEREYIESIEPAALQGWLAALDRNLALWIDCLPHTLFCVDADGQRLGFAMWLPDSGTATLVSIQVLHSHRRQGLGRLLLEAFEQRTSLGGSSVAKLGVHQSNPARLLYQSAGYKTAGQDGDFLLFSKVLNE